MNGEWAVSCCSDGTCQVSKAAATYPIKFLVPTKDNNFSIIYLLGFGGGLVEGDCVRIHGSVHENAVAVLKTQGSTKIFKSTDNKHCEQEFVATIAQNGLLVYIPDPTTCFKQARFKQHQRYVLHPLGSLIAVDWYTSGRMSEGEKWEMECLQTKLEIIIDSRRVLLENLDLHDTIGIASIAEKVGNAAVFGSIVLVGPRTEMLRTRAGAIMHRQTFKQRREHGDETHREIGDESTLVSVSHLGVGVTVVRFIAYSTEDAYIFLMELLAPLSTGVLSCLIPPYSDRVHRLPCDDTGHSRVVHALREYDRRQLAPIP